MKHSSGHRRSEAATARKRPSAHRPKPLHKFKLTPPYKQSASWWKLHGLLTHHLKRRGFQGGSLIALRVLSEGIYPALFTVLLAYWLAVEDARIEWGRVEAVQRRARLEG